MALPPDLAHLVQTALPVCARHGLAVAGGLALIAHGFDRRPSRHLDLVTFSSTPAGDIGAALAGAYTGAGCEVTALPGTPLAAQLEITPPGGAPHGVQVAKRPLCRPPVLVGLGLSGPVPVAALEDCAALKVASVVDRATVRDLVDLYALAVCFTPGEMLALAGHLDEDLQPRLLADRLDKLVQTDDTAYSARGLDGAAVAAAKRWAADWAQDIRLDLMEGMEHPDELYDL
ncbi:nucleotidyl transferase AbiEii/AbiGii toxin family protein [Streptomyces sp. ME01-24h]|nr:nucleotidyl transferase AbiEii/AbiGii toxin family protein [Streptomyces sp. ME01-24h]